jgi:hypothetical protein
MNKFIVVESASSRGDFINVSIDHISYFHSSSGDGTALYMSNGNELFVAEAPKQVEMLINQAQTGSFDGKADVTTS